LLQSGPLLDLFDQFESWFQQFIIAPAVSCYEDLLGFT